MRSGCVGVTRGRVSKSRLERDGDRRVQEEQGRRERREAADDDNDDDNAKETR